LPSLILKLEVLWAFSSEEIFNEIFHISGMDDMPPLEGDAEDASRMEEVD